MIETSELKILLEECKSLASRAGMAIFAMAGELLGVETKADGSPVTLADRASHDIIISALAKLTPSIPIISEESDGRLSRPETKSKKQKRDDLYWLIDPLDGTKEFIRGLSDYSVNLALVDQSKPILGVIHAPAIDTLYFAAHDIGAFKETGGCQAEPIRPHSGQRPLIAVTSRSHSNSETVAFLSKLQIQCSIPRGSSIKICAVADGQADIYPRIGPTYYWDTAAGTAIARQAGCLVKSLSGKDLSYHPNQTMLHRGFVVVPENNRELVDRVEKILGEDQPPVPIECW